MRQKDKYTGLDLTPEQRATIERYEAWVHQKRMASRLAPFYAEIDRQFPELEGETRDELAERMFRKQMSEFALKRSAPRTE